jgi:ABC-2 type transport system permease protein
LYALGALFADRKDRSILFWKSLPVSEIECVLIKLFFATFVIPLTAILIGFVLMFLSTFVTASAIAQSETYSWFSAWRITELLALCGNFLVAVLVGGLALIPTMSWLLLVSSYANRMPVVFAVIVPGLAMLFEVMFFDTHIVSRYIYDVLGLYVFDFAWSDGGTPWRNWHIQLPTAVQFIEMVITTALCLYTAVWLRNNRYEN